ncbi:hypothetical protein RRG08_019673 [Elysia crispata]|uniref:Uncharacterized protein n=1 Tax=Elysia crispata TaxID=231223 RepID=A0AAE0YWG9_9GAST|nr:hypothetical protein RRG08_019673 [Elysia crispata]
MNTSSSISVVLCDTSSRESFARSAVTHRFTWWISTELSHAVRFAAPRLIYLSCAGLKGRCQYEDVCWIGRPCEVCFAPYQNPEDHVFLGLSMQA